MLLDHPSVSLKNAAIYAIVLLTEHPDNMQRFKELDGEQKLAVAYSKVVNSMHAHSSSHSSHSVHLSSHPSAPHSAHPSSSSATTVAPPYLAPAPSVAAPRR